MVTNDDDAMVYNLIIAPKADGGASASGDGDEDEMGALGGDGEDQDSDVEEDNHGVSPAEREFLDHVNDQLDMLMQDVAEDSDDD